MLFLSLLLLPVPLLLLPPIGADPGSRGNSFSLGSTTPMGTPTPTGPDILTSSMPFSIAAVALGKYGLPGAGPTGAANGWPSVGGENTPGDTAGDGRTGGSWEAGERADAGCGLGSLSSERSSGSVPARLGRGGGTPFAANGGVDAGLAVEYRGLMLGDPL